MKHLSTVSIALGILSASIISILVMLVLIDKHIDSTKVRVGGPVTEKYRTPAGYKVQPEWRIVFYSDSLQKKIDIEVSPTMYANLDSGELVSFRLRPRDLE